MKWLFKTVKERDELTTQPALPSIDQFYQMAVYSANLQPGGPNIMKRVPK
jgi:hypothetical protein